MQLGIESQILDGLLAANALLAENSRQGVPTSTHTLHRGFEFAISSTVLGFQFRCSESASDPVVAPNSQILPCFVKGAVIGAVGAVAVGLVATLAAPVVGATAVTGALLVGAAVGAAYLGSDIYSNYSSGNKAGLAYDAGSVFGGVLGGALTGNGTASGIKSGASRGWNFSRDIANRITPSKGWNPLPWLGTGPDGGAAAGGQAGAAQAIPRKGC